MSRVFGAFGLVALMLGGCTSENPAFAPPTSDAAVGGDTTGPDLREPPAPADVGADRERDLLPEAAPEAPPEAAAEVAAEVAAEAAAEVAGPDRPVEASSSRLARRVTLTPATPTGPHGGTNTEAFREDCADDEVLIGYELWTSSPIWGPITVGRLEGQCAELWISAGPPFTVELRAGSRLVGRGNSKGAAYSALCGPNQAAVGFFGRAGGSLDLIGFRCASFELVDGPTPRLRVASEATVGPFGGDGGLQFEDGCAAGTVARGHEGHAGTRLDSLSLHCANASVPP